MSARARKRVIFEQLYEDGERRASTLMNRAHLSRSCVYKYMAKMEAGESLTPKRRRKGAYKFTPEIRRSMAQLNAQNPENSDSIIAAELNERFGGPFSVSGVNKHFKSMGNRIRVAKQKQLRLENKQARLEYAQRNLRTDWSRLWSYDECSFNLWKRSHRVRSNRRTSYRLARAPLSNSQESVSISVCLAISRTGKSALCFLPKNWRVQDLSDIWEEELLPSIDWDPTHRRCRAFIIDNDGRHHSHVLQVTASLHGLNRNGHLPPNSPDLNPIENLWHTMKNFVHQTHPTNERELRQAVLDAYDSIQPGELQNLFDSLPDRMQAVIAASGDRIPY